MTRSLCTSLGLVLLAMTVPFRPIQADDVAAAEALFQKHCQSCHGENRLGGTGPALLPSNLQRLRQKQAAKVIREGRVATQMPAFAEVLDEAQVVQLLSYIYSEPEQTPRWTASEIAASRLLHKPAELLAQQVAKKPVYKADPLNLFLVVESGDHHVSVLDGDTFERLTRFKSRYALHGGPKYSSDGRYVYFASRDGWISKYDMHTLEMLVETRAGINTRNAAISADNRFLIVGNYLPNNLVILDADTLETVRIIDVADNTGKSSRVSAVYDATPRESFLVALKDIPEVWEISYRDPPPAGFGEPWTHDYRTDSGDASAGGMFPLRRYKTEAILDDFLMSQDYSQIIGASRDGQSAVLDLDLKRVIAQPPLDGMPHLSSGITWDYKGGRVMATPDLKKPVVTMFDTRSWEVIKTLPTQGPGFFMRSHENSPYAWVDVFFGEHKDAMHIIDKASLEIVKTLIPEPGKTSAHIEFTRDGRYALLSIWEDDGAVIVYDAKTLEEVKRIPMRKPVGKYNVWNKITRSEGTSH